MLLVRQGINCSFFFNISYMHELWIVEILEYIRVKTFQRRSVTDLNSIQVVHLTVNLYTCTC